ncbi:MAG: PilZ domain-containing protein [Symbiobacteriaceae bacterium]|nr:PilZ domain-containing protein [Symbiobacteriaceae bacterium]
MLYSHSPRSYIRTDNWEIIAKISEDKEQWSQVQVIDISAGGLLFHTEDEFEPGTVLWFDLFIDPKMPEIPERIHMEVRARVSSVRQQFEEVNAVGVVFIQISLGDQVRLDELIRLAVTRYGGVPE